MTDFAVVAQSCGAVYYTPPPLRAVRGLSFTFEQLDAFVGRVLKLNAEAAVSEAVPPALHDELIRVARLIEDLKRPCGMDPESAQAIRNGQYQSIALIVRGLAAAPATPPVPQPVAWVPIHPRNGPLWSMATDKPDAERLPGSYPLMLLYAAPSPAPQPLTGKLVPEAFWISFCEFIRDWQGGDFELPELARLDVQACLAALEPRPGIALDGASPAPAWIPVTERLPAGDARHGYSERVIVNVVCDNGVVFRDSDKYDTLSETWDRHHTDNGRRVTDWMPMPPEPASSATSPTPPQEKTQ